LSERGKLLKKDIFTKNVHAEKSHEKPDSENQVSLGQMCHAFHYSILKSRI